MPEFDESNISMAELKRILPEDAMNEVAKNLINDMMQAPPPFHLVGGNELYTLGNHTVHAGGDNFIYLQVTVPEEFGKEYIDERVKMDLDDDLFETIEQLGLDEEETIGKIALFILSSVNTGNEIHNYASALRDYIGEYAVDSGKGETDSGEILSGMNNNIDMIIEKSDNQKDIYYLRGVKIHIKSIISDTVSAIKDAVELYNEAIDELELHEEMSVNLMAGRGYDDIETDTSVVNEVFGWIVNPLEYINQNQDIRFNLTQYESQYGQLPRQPELPGIEAKG